jgi:hypothetical protein
MNSLWTWATARARRRLDLMVGAPFHAWTYLALPREFRRRGVTAWRRCRLCGREEIRKPWYGGWRSTKMAGALDSVNAGGEN